jgi:hypothetical protein
VSKAIKKGKLKIINGHNNEAIPADYILITLLTLFRHDPTRSLIEVETTLMMTTARFQ